MSCTSKMRCEFGGRPLLPGSREWLKHRAKLDGERERVDEMTYMVDCDPPKVMMPFEIDLAKMRAHESRKLKIEMENKFMINNLSKIHQSKGDVESAHSRNWNFRSSHQTNGKMALKKHTGENFRLAMDFQRIESDYDHINMAISWISNRSNKYRLDRYKRDLWKPVFEKQKRYQENRGRGLDPHYVWHF